MKAKVLILGSTGMLGSIITDFLSLDTDLEIIATARDEAMIEKCKKIIPNVSWKKFQITETAKDLASLESIGKVDWIINSIGVIKPHIVDTDQLKVENAIRTNSLFPHTLEKYAKNTGAKVIQIATDCVYSGKKGRYAERDEHDALDVYGKSKSLGEISSSNTHILRCSIIGPEGKSKLSLLEWFLNQKENAEVSGFTNHLWNGVTTLHFAKLCKGIIKQKIILDRPQHIIPGSEISKYDLLKSFAKNYNRGDIKIKPTEATKIVDRTLTTETPDINTKLWKAAGYEKPPTIEEMVKELSEFKYRFEGV